MKRRSPFVLLALSFLLLDHRVEAADPPDPFAVLFAGGNKTRYEWRYPLGNSLLPYMRRFGDQFILGEGPFALHAYELSGPDRTRLAPRGSCPELETRLGRTPTIREVAEYENMRYLRSNVLGRKIPLALILPEDAALKGKAIPYDMLPDEMLWKTGEGGKRVPTMLHEELIEATEQHGYRGRFVKSKYAPNVLILHPEQDYVAGRAQVLRPPDAGNSGAVTVPAEKPANPSLGKKVVGGAKGTAKCLAPVAVDKAIEAYDNWEIKGERVNGSYWRKKHGTDYMEWNQCEDVTDVLYQSGQRAKAILHYLLNWSNPDVFNSPYGAGGGT